MKKHFKKLLEFLLFGIPLVIRVLLKMENKNQYKVGKLSQPCSRCGTRTYHPSLICAVCREIESRSDKNLMKGEGQDD